MILYILKLKNKNIVKIGRCTYFSRIMHLNNIYNIEFKNSYIIYADTSRTIKILEQHLLNITKRYKIDDLEKKEGFTELRHGICMQKCMHELINISYELDLSFECISKSVYLFEDIYLRIKMERKGLSTYFKDIIGIFNDCYVFKDMTIIGKDFKPRKEQIIGGSYCFYCNGKYRTKKWIRENCVNIFGRIIN